MDRITTALLKEFCSENAIEHLPEDQQFDHFAAFLTISRHHSSAFDTADVVTGGGGDTGIDAVGIVVNGSLVTDPELIGELEQANGFLDATFVFVQATRSASFEGAKIGQFGFGVRDFFSEDPSLPRNELIADAAGVMSALYDRSSRFTRGNPACRLYYVSPGNWVEDANLNARRKAAIDDLKDLRMFRDVEFVPVDADFIQKLYSQTKNAITREFTFSERTVVPEIPGVTEAYMGLVPAKEFLNLITEDGGEIIKSLFYDNVRDFQDFNVVNNEIRETLASPVLRPRFALMNNGVTIIAKELRPTGNKIHIQDFQIVNGCQTSHVLYDQREKLAEDVHVLVPLRVIATRDEEVIASIIKATNRQTEVKAEQLLALSDFQKKLEIYFSSFDEAERLYYERRSRQYNSINGIEKTRIVTPANLIRAYAAMILEEPHRTTRTYRALLNNVGVSIFGPDHRLEPYYMAASALYRLEFLFRNYALDAKYKPARYHVLLAARMLATNEVPPQAKSHQMQRYATRLANVFWQSEQSQHLFLRAAGVVDEVAQGNFDRDHIRTEPFTEDLKLRCEEIQADG